ncbi:MAG: hypothetical protein WCL36_03620 [bacterium]|jgi:hypothetical protein|nr:hypothetical protein [bacterium]
MTPWFLIMALWAQQGVVAKFPTIVSDNLEGKTFTLPRDFAGKRNVVFVPFLREQQSVVDGWVPFVKQQLAAHPGTDYYELPTIKKMIGLMKWTINKGMSGGIADKSAREHTITLYTDKAPLKQSLAITDESLITILVVDKEGKIYWRETGAFTPEKGASLAAALAAPVVP